MGNYSFNGCRNGSICGIPIYYFGDLEFFRFIGRNFNELDPKEPRGPRLFNTK